MLAQRLTTILPAMTLAEAIETTCIPRRLQAAAAHGLTRFVGRAPELASLGSALEQAGAGRGQIVAIIGEPGVGKSRLVHEFLCVPPTQSWLLLEGASVSYGKATPYFPVIELLKRYAHIEERDDPHTVRAKVTGQVLTLDETLQDTIPALLALLDAVKDVPVALLQAIAELPEEELRRGLTHLQAAEFLHETSLFPALEYTFKHPLTHEVAYDSLLQERRRAPHGRIVDAIERLHPDRLSEQVERLAHHALWGNVWEKAVTYCRQAGAKAFERSANRAAVACFEQALQALQHLPESQVTREQSIDLRFDLRQALVPLGELGRIHDALQEAERLATALDDQPRLGRALSYLSQ